MKQIVRLHKSKVRERLLAADKWAKQSNRSGDSVCALNTILISAFDSHFMKMLFYGYFSRQPNKGFTFIFAFGC